MRTAIYARSAIAGGCEAQLKELRANVLQLGWKIIGEYLDDGVSGLRSRRSALDRLMADGEKGMFECVVVSDLERLSRNPRQLMQHLAHLQQLGLRFLAMKQDVDSAKEDPLNSPLLKMLALVAE